MAVNVSARNLEAEAFPESVSALLAELGLPAGRLNIEITETALAADAVAAARAVGALAGQGITIAIDDFGKGYTSLSQLRTLPITELKIDRTFLMELERDERKLAGVTPIPRPPSTPPTAGPWSASSPTSRPRWGGCSACGSSSAT